jgi:hypothetical protein
MTLSSKVRRLALGALLVGAALLMPILQAPQAHASSDPALQLLDQWVNINSATRDIVRINIGTTPSGEVKAEVYGACSPTPCDWRASEVLDINGQETALYCGHVNFFGFCDIDETVTFTRVGAQLQTVTQTDFDDGSGRADYTMHDTFKVNGPPVSFG